MCLNLNTLQTKNKFKKKFLLTSWYDFGKLSYPIGFFSNLPICIFLAIGSNEFFYRKKKNYLRTIVVGNTECIILVETLYIRYFILYISG